MDIIKMLLEFVDRNENGYSYWADFEGGIHSADTGYVIEFLYNLKDYVESIGGMEEFQKRWNEYKAKR